MFFYYIEFPLSRKKNHNQIRTTERSRVPKINPMIYIYDLMK